MVIILDSEVTLWSRFGLAHTAWCAYGRPVGHCRSAYSRSAYNECTEFAPLNLLPIHCLPDVTLSHDFWFANNNVLPKKI